MTTKLVKIFYQKRRPTVARDVCQALSEVMMVREAELRSTSETLRASYSSSLKSLEEGGVNNLRLGANAKRVIPGTAEADVGLASL